MNDKYISTKLLYRYLLNSNKFERMIRLDEIKRESISGIRCISFFECNKLEDNLTISINNLEFRYREEIENIIDNYQQYSEYLKKEHGNTNILRKLLNDNYIESKMLFGKCYIKKSEIGKYANGRNKLIEESKLDIDEECIVLATVEKSLGVAGLRDRIIAGDLRGQLINEQWYISKQSLNEKFCNINVDKDNYRRVNEIQSINDFIPISKIITQVHLTKRRTLEKLKENNINIIVTEFKGSKCSYVDKESYQFLVDQLNNFNNMYFTTKEVEELFNMNPKAFLANKAIQSQITTPIFYGTKKCFLRSDIEKINQILKGQRKHRSDEKINYSIIRVAKELRTKQGKIEEFIKNGTFKNSKMSIENSIKKFYISQEDIDWYKRKYFFVFDSQYIILDSVANKIGVKAKWLNASLDTIHFFNNHYYCLKSELESLGYNIDSTESISIYCNEFDNIARELKISNNKLLEYIKNNEFPNIKIIKEGGINKYKFDGLDIQKYKEKYIYAFSDEYCRISELAYRYHYNYEWIKGKVSKVYEYGSGRFCIKSEGEKLCNERLELENLYNNMILENSKEAAYKYYLLYYTSKVKSHETYKETLLLYNSFAKQEINKTKARMIRSTVYNLGRALVELSEKLINIKKELFNLNDYEIDNIIFKYKYSKATDIILGKLVNFIRANKKNECKYNMKINRRSEINTKTRVESYTFELYMKYAVYVSRFEIHVQEAIKNSRYAQVWLYSIFHFCTAWRARDILDFPTFEEIMDLNVSRELSWYKENMLSEHNCEIVINHLQQNNYIANKNNNKVTLQIFKMFKMVFSTALVIAEIHRINKSEDFIFFSFKKYNPDLKDIKRFLRNSCGLEPFSSLALNRSFLNNFYTYTSSNTEFHKLAYFLTRKLRGHKTEDMAWTYINSLPNEDLDDCSMMVFENETFGYIKYCLASLIVLSDNKDFNKLSVNEKRNVMIKKYELPNVVSIEAFSKTLLLDQQIRISIVDELLKYDQEKLITKLKKIYNGLNPSFVKGIQCLKGKCRNNNEVKNCERCEYAIFTKLFLIDLNVKLWNSITKIIELLSFESIEFLKNIDYLQNMLNILYQALDENIGLGFNIVTAFIEINKLEEKINEIISRFFDEQIIKISNEYLTRIDINSIENEIIIKKYITIYNLYKYLRVIDGNTMRDIKTFIYKYLLKSLYSNMLYVLNNGENDNINTQIYLLKKLVKESEGYGISQKEISEIVDFKTISNLLRN